MVVACGGVWWWYVVVVCGGGVRSHQLISIRHSYMQ